MRQNATLADISRKHVPKLLDNYCVRDGRKFRLRDYDPADTAGYSMDKPEANALLEEGVKRLAELQEKLYAQHHMGHAVRIPGDGRGKARMAPSSTSCPVLTLKACR